MFLALYNRLVQLLATAPKGALSVTGILGLALLVYGYLQLRGNDNRDRREQQQREGQRAATGAADQRAVPGVASSATAAAPRQAAVAAASPAAAAAPASCAASATPVGRAVAAQLSGVKRVTLSLPGVLLVESTPGQLQESATVRQDAVEVLREMARVSDVYLLAHVEDDVGEAVVTGALESAGLLGTAPGKIKPYHVLCCSTLDGKVPIVRQLDPDLHVDGHTASVDELKRFLPRLLLVRDGLTGVSGSANVGTAPSLSAFFGL